MKTSTLTVTLAITGDGVNDQSIPLAAWQSTNSPGERFTQWLAAGNNTITLPPTSQPPQAGYVAVVVPTGMTVTMVGFYAINAGGGLILFPVNQVTPGTFVLNASVAGAVTIWVV